MSESILNALMHLFAIIADSKDKGVSNSARTIVQSYLRQQLNEKQADEYLELFDNYLEFYHRDIVSVRSEKGRKRGASNSVKVLKICQQINEGLHQAEKVIVLMRLIEFINEDGIITLEELDFVTTVADTFNIAENEFQNMKFFIQNQVGDILDQQHVLVIDNQEVLQDTEGSWFSENKPANSQEKKHIKNENLDGRIVILHIESINSFVLIYHGKSNLSLRGHNILPRHAFVFDHGSIIKGSRISPIYHSDISRQFLRSRNKTNISYVVKDIVFHFKNSTNGIQRFSSHEKSGNLVGIMGGSGVGKSTLLNVLNGNLTLNEGSISINGYDLHREKESLEGVIGLVPQDDLLIEELTVFQNVYYNAKLCFSNFHDDKIRKTVNKILIDMDLFAIKELTVGSPLNKFISGGQRKRLNIALELIREPSILFVDEPTSGLSSMDSENVMFLLKQQANKGKLVFVNIHQPSSDIYKLFDKLWIIDKRGHIIYNGNPIDAIVYFKKMSAYVNAEESECAVCGNVTPEQILQIIETKVVDEYGKFTRSRKVSPEQWYEKYQDNIESKLEIEADLKTERLPQNYFKIPPLGKQFFIFALRNIHSKLTNKQYMLINFFEAPLLAFILGFFTKHLVDGEYIFSKNVNLPIYLFMMVVVALFIGLTVSAEEIIKDRKIIQRESFLNLSRLSYINSKVTIMFVLSAVQALSFVLVGNFILEIQGMTFAYWLVFFSTAAFANMIGLNLSAGLNSVINIYISIPFILVPQLLLGGAMVSFDDLHDDISSKKYVPFVGDLMTARWAYEALAVEQFKENEFQKHFFEVDQKKSTASYYISYYLPKLKSKLTDKKNVMLLRNEFEKLNKTKELANWQFDKMDELYANKYTQQTLDAATLYLDSVKQIYRTLEAQANKQKDRIFTQLTSDPLQLKQNYTNGRLSDFVLNKMQNSKIYELPNELIRKKDLIYIHAESNLGRAQFYASEKKVFGYIFDTYWFNIVVIWLSSFLFYILLATDLLQRINHYIEKLRLNKN